MHPVEYLSSDEVVRFSNGVSVGISQCGWSNEIFDRAKKKTRKKKTIEKRKKEKRENRHIYSDSVFREWKTLIDIMFNFVDERSNRRLFDRLQLSVFRNRKRIGRFFLFFFLPLLFSLSLPSIFARNASERLFINATDRLLIRHAKFLKAFLPTGFELPDFLCLLRGTYSTRGIFHSYSFIRLGCIYVDGVYSK